MRIRYATFSETGRRYANQDVFRVEQISEGDATLMVVCDGMGGHAMGDVAAETVCNAVFDNWRRVSDDNMEDKIVEICRIVSKIFDERVVSMNYIQMGTTFVMAYIKDDVATIAHIGDSRCYLLRGRDVVYQTKDHVGVENGREGISKCFFSYRPDVAVPDVAQFKLQLGDRIFLCTDGVYRSMAPLILTERLSDDKPLEEVTDVIKFMCEKFSTDNYTAILAEII